MSIGTPEILRALIAILVMSLAYSLWRSDKNHKAGKSVGMPTKTPEEISAEKIVNEILEECRCPERQRWDEGMTSIDFVYPISPRRVDGWHDIWARVHVQMTKRTVDIEYACEFETPCFRMADAIHQELKKRGIHSTLRKSEEQPSGDEFSISSAESY